MTNMAIHLDSVTADLCKVRYAAVGGNSLQ